MRPIFRNDVGKERWRSIVGDAKKVTLRKELDNLQSTDGANFYKTDSRLGDFVALVRECC